MTASVSGTTGQMNVEPAPTTGTIVLWTKPPLTYMTKCCNALYNSPIYSKVDKISGTSKPSAYK
ncbi:hypothetical protein DEO72_LG3g1691 [Vigna unguiculata]|uniref:Uncharacterized protein n=1 Tax=Vigna unguiculata TaxID=3917 RepID=A0A4D6LF16_VIGUN|nr:hypothetical protein DEO72_LG3g1691 [Vigna unguiculata]